MIAEAKDDAGIGGIRVNGKQLVGEVDNSSFPEIDVKIGMTVVLPSEAKGPVPVLMTSTQWWS